MRFEVTAVLVHVSIPSDTQLWLAEAEGGEPGLCQEQKCGLGSGWWAGQGGFTLMHPGSADFFRQPLKLTYTHAHTCINTSSFSLDLPSTTHSQSDLVPALARSSECRD